MLLTVQKNYYVTLIKLAVPVALGQLGNIVTQLADSIIVGGLGTTAYSAVSFANNVFLFLFIFGIGLSTGLTPLVGKAFSEGNKERCRTLLQQGMLYNLFAGLAITIFNLGIFYLLPYFGQDADVVELAGPFYIYITFSIIPMMAYAACKQFLEGMGNQPMPNTDTSGLASLLKSGVNWWVQ